MLLDDLLQTIVPHFAAPMAELNLRLGLACLGRALALANPLAIAVRAAKVRDVVPRLRDRRFGFRNFLEADLAYDAFRLGRAPKVGSLLSSWARCSDRR